VIINIINIAIKPSFNWFFSQIVADQFDDGAHCPIIMMFVAHFFRSKTAADTIVPAAEVEHSVVKAVVDTFIVAAVAPAVSASASRNSFFNNQDVIILFVKSMILSMIIILSLVMSWSKYSSKVMVSMC
jgi:hypothetical protein